MLNPLTLRTWREARGLSRTAAARLLGTRPGTIQRLEQRGGVSALWGPLTALAAALDAADAADAQRDGTRRDGDVMEPML